MNIRTAIDNRTKGKLFVSLASRPGRTGLQFYTRLFDLYNIDAEYQSCVCTDLYVDLELAREHCAGVSITMPFKRQAASLVDEADSPVINTIKIIDNKLIGHNCDLSGLKDMLTDVVNGKTVSILGDGAMAENVRTLCSDVQQYSRKLSNWNLRHSMCDVLINTTSIGMTEGESPVDYLEHCGTVVDCVIGNTALTKLARDKNIPCITGQEIYLAQLKHQFKMYTDVDLEDRKSVV